MLLLPSEKKKCKLVECCTRHVVRDNLSELEIDFIAQNYYKIVFERKLNCMNIFLVTIKKKHGFSSNTHVL